MRATQYILIILILSTLNVNGQDTFVTKSHSQILLEIEKETPLEREIVSDSIQYELRMWYCDFFYPDKVIQFTKDFNGNWSYRPGYFRSDTTTTFVFQDSIIKKIDWSQFEIKLDSFVDAKVPSQNEIELRLVIDGQTYTLKNEDFFSSIMDGGSYTIEIYDNKSYKTIYYNNPHSYLESLLQKGLPNIEHEDFIKFINYIYEDFELKELRRIQMKEILDNKDKKKSKKKKQKKKKISS